MRNTIFTKALTVMAFLAAGAGMGPAQAQSLEGCWARSYSATHLAGQPAQVVRDIMLRVHPGGAKSTTANLSVIAANQGHAGKRGQGGQLFETFLLCDRTARGWRCAVECDGGSLTVTRLDGKVLEFRTDYLMTGYGDSCGGLLDLAEIPGRPVTYRLYRQTGKPCTWE